MTIREAEQIMRVFESNESPDPDEIFTYTEAAGFLIEKTHDPRAMMSLGGYYYGARDYDLALKYYEMAAEYKYIPAYECLGYVWYYGRTGVKDYEKAFHYFTLGKEAGHLVSAYKLADMYRNGYYVEKDTDKYREIIEELYERVKGLRDVFDPVPEVFTRLAKIRTEQGEIKEAVRLYFYARDFLAQRIMYNHFFGNLSIMKWLIHDLYQLIAPDPDPGDLYDLYHFLERPCLITFMYDGETHEVEAAEEEDGTIAIRFDENWYRDPDSFFNKARLDDDWLTSQYGSLYDFEVK
ncbi:MAG: tetratricopeptide repeat protein [Clostridia bacterium]|nr:tetratricopeptide repeat protein [Clostridia bacterium]